MLLKGLALGSAILGGSLVPALQSCEPEPQPYFSSVIEFYDRLPNGVVATVSGLAPASGTAVVELWCTVQKEVAPEQWEIVRVIQERYHSGNFGNTTLNVSCPNWAPHLWDYLKWIYG